MTGLPADGLVIQTDDPDLAFGGDASVSAVDACSGLEVAVVSCHPPVPYDNGVRRWMASYWDGRSCRATLSHLIFL